MKYALKSLLAAALATAALAGQAAVVPIDGSSSVFNGAAPITFSEVALGSTNPTIGSVTFGSFFAGQSLGSIFTCGGIISNCVLGNPTGGSALALAPSPIGLAATTVTDPANTGSPVLGGSANFTLGNPIAMLFAQDVSAVSFSAGGFNNLSNTRVTAFSRTGEILGQLLNPGACPAGSTCPPDPLSPLNFFSFAFGSTDANNNPFNQIAGILISVIGFESQGFAIDNVRTVVTPASSGSTSSGTTSSGEPPGQTPEPTSLALVGLALLGLGAMRRRKV